MKILSATRAALGLALLLLLSGCRDGPWNNPNPPSPEGQLVYQSVMSPAPPKHLDPAVSYASDENLFLSQIYESPMGYHFLKRPYELIPLGVEDRPVVTFLDEQGNEVAEEGDVAFSRYTLKVRPDARYQPHPSLAVDDSGDPLYLFDSASEGARFRSIPDFPQMGDRAVHANDYVYGIKRLADPELGSPMLGFMAQYIVGMKEFTAQLAEVPRDQWLNLDEYPMEGLKVVDEHTLTLTIYGRYPQFIYWLAMRFFSPIPPEVDRFYHNPGFIDRNLTLDWWPVGSGPFMMEKNDPNSEIVLVRNPNFRKDYFPSEGGPGDLEAGNLVDAG